MTILRVLRRLQSGLLDLVFPPQCVICHAPGVLLCAECPQGFSRMAVPVCRVCGRPVGGRMLCPACREVPLEIDGIRSVFLLEDGVRRVVHQFKYYNRPGLAEPLADLMADHWRRFPLAVELVIPVPLHAVRRRERGYNQADLLARAFGCIVNLPVVNDVLRRVRYTRAQVGLNALDRRSNVAGAFWADPARGNPVLAGRRVLLMDDVCTTGATLEACSQALKAVGAAEVWGFTLTRAAGAAEGVR